MGFFILVFRVVGIYADWCNDDVFWPCWQLRSFIITLFLVFFFSDHVMMVFFLSVDNLRRLIITRQIFPMIASSCIWSVCLCYFQIWLWTFGGNDTSILRSSYSFCFIVSHVAVVSEVLLWSPNQYFTEKRACAVWRCTSKKVMRFLSLFEVSLDSLLKEIENLVVLKI